MKFPKRILVWLLTVSMLFGLLGTTAFADENDRIPDPISNHGTLQLTDPETLPLSLQAGETVLITVSPYIHVQYQGCGMGYCPETCGRLSGGAGTQVCFIEGRGCSCDLTPAVRTATVTVFSDNEAAVKAGGITTEGTVGTEAGSMTDGTLTVQAVGPGTAHVTVTAALYDWYPVTQTYTFTVAANEPEPEPAVLSSITVTAAPDKTSYTAGETFDPSGMAVTAAYTDGTSAVVTDFRVYPETPLAETDTEVTVSYTEGGVSVTAQVPITVTAAAPEPDDTPGSDTPGSDTPGSDAPGSDTPGSDAPGSNTPGYADCLRDSTCPISKFTDAGTTAWYHDGVHYCLDAGLMNGTASTAFAPDSTTTRGMIVTILWRLEGSPAANYAMNFSDVGAEEWYTDAVGWAVANNIVYGYGGGIFGPNDLITREQMVTILWRYSQYKGYDVSAGASTDILSYTDGASVSSYAIPAMQWACGAGLIQGMGDGCLAPTGGATRAQAAVILMRYCENIGK